MRTASSGNPRNSSLQIIQPVYFRLIIPLSIILFLLISGFAVSLILIQQQNQAQLSRHIQSDALRSLQVSLARQAAMLTALGDILLNDLNLSEALRNQDRERLLALYKDLFSTLRDKHAVTHLYFHLPSRVNLLRVHKPEKHGDVINRFTAREAERTGETAWGIELGPLGTFTLRVVQPVRVDGILVGYLELGQEIEGLLRLLHERLGVDLAVTIHKNALNRQQWEAGMKMLNRSADWERYRTEVLIYYSQPEFSEDYDSLVHGNGEHLHDRPIKKLWHGGKFWRVYASPLHDVSGADVGDLLFFQDVTATKRSFMRHLMVTSFLALILLGGLFSLLHVMLRKIDKSILAQQAELSASDSRHRSLLEAINRSGLFLFVVDKEYRVRYMNEAMIQGLGNAVGKICYRDVAGYPEPCPYCRLRLVIEDQETARYQATLLDGRSFTMIAAPYIDVDGSSCKLEVMQDITEQKHVEQEKMLLQEKLQRAQKMEAIGLLAGGVAHDLNNILSGIVAYPELILMKLPQDSELRKPLLAILESGKRAAAVVDDLLTVARGVAIVKTVHDLHTLVRENSDSPECTLLKSLHPGITFRYQLTASRSNIRCSTVHIKKALVNLVTNAVEAIAEKGTISITTTNQSIKEPEAAKYNLPQGDYVVLTVRDTGLGISQEDVEHIFDPFYTKKKMGRSGTGLGLTVVFNTVQDHGGKIMVTSDSAGTSFALYFPVREEDADHIRQVDSVDREALQGNGEHILVVDDEPQLRDIACQMLTSLGYNVVSVCSGELAVKYVQKTPVDVLVLDMIMDPGMNGLQTYKEITKLYPGQKAIIASGFSESDDVKTALQLGAGGFIKKPYSMTELGRAIKLLLHRE